MYEKFPAVTSLPKILEMDYSRILNKPFFIKNVTWTTTNPANLVLDSIPIPSGVLTNPLVQIPFQSSVYYRAKIAIIAQVSGTPMHAGAILMASTPIGGDGLGASPRGRINSYMAGPHVFLSANECTPAMLEVPFFVSSKLASSNLDGNTNIPTNYTGNFASVVLQVFNQLSSPTSGSTSLTISLHVVFKELEFYVPHVNPTYISPTAIRAFTAESLLQTAKGFVTDVFDNSTSGLKSGVGSIVDGIASTISSTKPLLGDAIDVSRGYLRSLTGLHNPADTTIDSKQAVQFRQYNNMVDAPLQLEKMDPYSQFSHFTRDYTFDTARDEMDVFSIISKPQYLGTFTVTSADVAGKLLWSKPITPYQEVTYNTNSPPYSNNSLPTQTVITTTALIQHFYNMSRYWRGPIKIHIQSVMSNFQFCKLTLARNYSNDIRALTQVPSFDSIPNLMMESAEFSGGGQVQTFELPFCSPLEQLPTVLDLEANALMHGMYYIYLHQPLVNNGSATYSARFNVFISAGEGFQYFGYNSRPLVGIFPPITDPIGRANQNSSDTSTTVVGVKSDPWGPSPVVPVPSLDPISEEPALTSFSAESAPVEATQEDVDFKITKTESSSPTDLRPIVNVRDYVRRFQRVYYDRFLPADLTDRRGFFIFDVASLVGCRAPDYSVPSGVIRAGTSTLRTINSMFLGYSGGARFKICLNGANMAEVWYVPPGFTTNPQGSLTAEGQRTWRSTAPFPFTVSLPRSSDSTQCQFSQYQFMEKTPFASTVSSDCWAMMCSVERPNWISVNATTDTAFDTGTGGNRMQSSGCTFEFEVPHMSPYRFVGDATKSKYNINGLAHGFTGETNMGHIVVKIAEPLIYYPSVTTINANIAIEILASLDDVGRLGYQVFSPTMQFPIGVNTTPNVGVYDPVWMVPEVTLTGGAIPNVHPKAKVVSNATPPVYTLASCYFNS